MAQEVIRTQGSSPINKKPSRVIFLAAIAFVVALGVWFAVSRIAGKPSIEAEIVQEESMALFSEDEELIPTIPVTTFEPREWVDYYRNGELLWEASTDLTLDEFPGVVFNFESYRVTATDSKGTKDILGGMPVWNVFLADLNGDGLPEFCATVSIGSGIIDTRVIVYDYANDRQYDLSDRMVFDYSLAIEDGQLVVKQARFPGNMDDDYQATGTMAIIDGELVIFGLSRFIPEREQ